MMPGSQSSPMNPGSRWAPEMPGLALGQLSCLQAFKPFQNQESPHSPWCQAGSMDLDSDWRFWTSTPGLLHHQATSYGPGLQADSHRPKFWPAPGQMAPTDPPGQCLRPQGTGLPFIIYKRKLVPNIFRSDNLVV